MSVKKDFVSNFSKVLFSISILALCSALFVFSIHNLKANENNTFDFPDKLTEQSKMAIQNSGGRYQMSISVINSNTDDPHWYILVWDATTGRSKFYYGNVQSGTNASYDKYQLPAKPL